MLKISTDGAVLTKKKHAVQGTLRIIQLDENNKPVRKSTLPERFNKEILLFYYIGNYFSYHILINQYFNIRDFLD